MELPIAKKLSATEVEGLAMVSTLDIPDWEKIQDRDRPPGITIVAISPSPQRTVVSVDVTPTII